MQCVHDPARWIQGPGPDFHVVFLGEISGLRTSDIHTQALVQGASLAHSDKYAPNTN